MSFMGKIGGLFKGKKVAAVTNPNLNNQLSQAQNDRLMSQNTFARDPNYVVPIDEDENDVPDMLEVKHKKEYGDGNKELGKLNPFTFKQPRKDYNQSFDGKGRYVRTMTYPLPPISHDKKMFARNRRLNNKDNKFF